MNPIQQIREQGHRIENLEAQVGELQLLVARLLKLEQDEDSGKQPAEEPATPRRRLATLVRPLAHEARELLVFAWSALTEGRDLAAKPVTQRELLEAVAEIDEAGVFPKSGGHIGATVRATIAEMHGLRIRWSANTLRARAPGEDNDEPVAPATVTA